MVIISGLLMPPFPDQGMFWHLVPMDLSPRRMLLMTVGILEIPDGLHMEINYQMYGFPMIFLLEPKFMHIPYSRKVGGFRKEHRKIGRCRLRRTMPIGQLLIRLPIRLVGQDGRQEPSR